MDGEADPFPFDQEPGEGVLGSLRSPFDRGAVDLDAIIDRGDAIDEALGAVETDQCDRNGTKSLSQKMNRAPAYDSDTRNAALEGAQDLGGLRGQGRRRRVGHNRGKRPVEVQQKSRPVGIPHDRCQLVR